MAINFIMREREEKHYIYDTFLKYLNIPNFNFNDEFCE